MGRLNAWSKHLCSLGVAGFSVLGISESSDLDAIEDVGAEIERCVDLLFAERESCDEDGKGNDVELQ